MEYAWERLLFKNEKFDIMVCGVTVVGLTSVRSKSVRPQSVRPQCVGSKSVGHRSAQLSRCRPQETLKRQVNRVEPDKDIKPWSDLDEHICPLNLMKDGLCLDRDNCSKRVFL